MFVRQEEFCGLLCSRHAHEMVLNGSNGGVFKNTYIGPDSIYVQKRGLVFRREVLMLETLT